MEFTKNCFDLSNITITIVLSFVFVGHLVGVGAGTILAMIGVGRTGHLVGVGAGTILAMIGVGRTIAVFNHFAYEKMKQMAGVEE